MATEINITAKLNLGDFNTSITGMKQEMRALQKVLGNALLSESDKAQVINRMAAIRDEMTDLNSGFKNIDASNPFQNISTALGPVTAGLSAIASTTALIGSENEQLNAIMQKVSATMAILAAAAQLNDIKRLKSLYEYLGAQTLALAANIREALTIGAITVATEGEAVAKTKVSLITKGLIVLQKAWNVAVKANPIMLVISAVAALTVGIIALSHSMSDNAKYSNAMQKAQEDMAKAVGDEMSQLSIMKARLDDQNLSQAQRIKLVDDLMKKYPTYLNDIDRENLLVGDTAAAFDKLAAAIQKKALVEALSKQQAELSSKIVEKTLEQIKLETILRGKGTGVLSEFNKGYKDVEGQVRILKSDLAELNEQQRVFSRVIANQTNNLQENTTSMSEMATMYKQYIGLGNMEEFAKKTIDEANKLAADASKKAVDDLKKLRESKLNAAEKEIEDYKNRAEDIAKINKDLQDKMTEELIQGETDRKLYRLKIDYENSVDLLNKELANYKKAEQKRSDYFYKIAKDDVTKNEDMNLLKYLTDQEYAKLSEDDKKKRLDKRKEYDNKYGKDYVATINEIGKQEYELLTQLYAQINILTSGYEQEKTDIEKQALRDRFDKQLENSNKTLELHEKELEAFTKGEKDKQDLLDETNKKAEESRTKMLGEISSAGENILTTFYTAQFDQMFADLDYQWEQYYNNLEQRRDYDIANLEDQVKRGVMTEEEYQIQKTNVEKMAEAKRKEAEKKAFNQEQSLNKSKAVMDGAVAAAKSFANLGWPLGIPAALAALAAVAIQINTINNQKPPYAKGGWINGPSHSGGGVDVNAEGDEFIVNKKSMQNPTNAAVVETINQGGGIDFAALVSEVVSQIAEIPVNVSEGDITRTQRSVKVIENNSKIM